MTRVQGKKKQHWMYFLFGGALLIGGAAFLISNAMQGKTTISNPESTVVKSVSLSCEGEDIVYPFFQTTESSGQSMKVSAVFDNGRLDTISLTYRLDFDNEKAVERTYSNGAVAMNKAFINDGLGMDALGMKFSNLSDRAQMTLYAKADELNGVSAKYFLLDGASNYNRNVLAEKYRTEGLDCTLSK